MDIIVDVECFANDVIKELAIANQYFNLNFSFRPPYPFVCCTSVEKHRNSWRTRYFHGIAWDSGKYAYSELPKIVSHLKNSGAVYYGKGEQKCALLGKLFKEKFHNLEEFDCPKLMLSLSTFRLQPLCSAESGPVPRLVARVP